jgi:hypothetical protein
VDTAMLSGKKKKKTKKLKKERLQQVVQLLSQQYTLLYQITWE